MNQTPKRSSGKGKGRVQQAAKGCCCKRSQCIKNYCDCYQSMMVCTQFCRCVGCRNTEERMAVEPRTPSRNSSSVKRDRAAAMSAKAAAAAAKEGLNIPVKPGSNNSMPITIVPIKQQKPTAPINVIRMAPEALNMVLQQVSTMPPPSIPPMGDSETEEIPATPDFAMKPQDPEVEPMETELPNTDLNQTHNLFYPNINGAQLLCALTQGSEGEDFGLNDFQVGRLIVGEFETCYKDVSDKMLYS